MRFDCVHYYLWILLLGGKVIGSPWWLLAISGAHQTTIREAIPTAYKTICKNSHFLVDRQKELCIADQDILKIITDGATAGILECQHQFAHNRWNCTTFENSTAPFGSAVSLNTREKAYVYAVSAAGVAYAVSKSCSKGEIAGCSCDKKIFAVPTDGTFQWGGCSDNVIFGDRFSRDFTDLKEPRFTSEGLMNLHNNQAGRWHIRHNMQRSCKCHGVSGSCTRKVCWLTLSTFRKIGESIKDKFDGAHQMKLNSKKKRLRTRQRRQKYPMRDDLVYLEESPDYCEQNVKYGILGTKGRRCNSTSHGMDGCGLLCCGRGYLTVDRTEIRECNCKFVYCCRRECKKCIEKSEDYFCK